MKDHCNVKLRVGTDKHTLPTEQKADGYKWLQLPTRYKWDPKMQRGIKLHLHQRNS